MLTMILLVLAFVLFLVGSFYPYPGVAPTVPFYARVNLISLGLAAWVLSILLGGAHAIR